MRRTTTFFVTVATGGSHMTPIDADALTLIIRRPLAGSKFTTAVQFVLGCIVSIVT